jgi:hypothetical protein
MTTSQLLEFMRTQRLAVETSVGLGDEPQVFQDVARGSLPRNMARSRVCARATDMDSFQRLQSRSADDR